MELIHKLELKLNDVLFENAPVQLPEVLRRWLAKYAYAFVLLGFIVGVIQIVLVPFKGLAAVFGPVIGRSDITSVLMAMSLMTIVSTIFLGYAFPRLKRKEKVGWDLIFILSLIGIVFDGLTLVTVRLNDIVTDVVMYLLGVVFSLYVLFQIRSYFKKGEAVLSAKIV